jgi:hypothetical protein
LRKKSVERLAALVFVISSTQQFTHGYSATRAVIQVLLIRASGVELCTGQNHVTVELPGFKTAKRTGITLNTGTRSVQNFTLEVGGTDQTVEVQSSALQLNTTSATIGNIIEHITITAMPLNGRNPLNLIVLEPGVVQTGSTGVNVNGMRSQSGNVTIDGIEANEASNPTPVNNVFRINPDNVQEFKVTTSNPTPEEGKNAGLNVSMATRSGGNEFHGSAVEYFRNTVLNANDAFANAQNNPRTFISPPPARSNLAPNIVVVDPNLKQATVHQ